MLVDVIFQDHSDWHKAYSNSTKEIKIGKFNGDYHPFGMYDSKKLFIYGEGYVRPTAKSTKTIEIPDFNTVEELKLFLDTYGKFVTYRALTNQDLGSQDCCWKKHQCDFTAMLEVGLDKWFEGMTIFHKMLSKMSQIYMDKWGWIMDNELIQAVKNNYKNTTFRSDLFIPSLSHYIAYPYRSLPYLDPIKDDNRLVQTYIKLELDGDFNRYYNENMECIDTIFPESVADRITFLFDAEVCEMYKTLMNFFTTK